MAQRIMVVVGIALLASSGSAQAQGARLQLDALDRLAARAAEVVNVTIDPAMLQLAGAFMNTKGGDAAVKELLAGVEGIYVKSFEFEQEVDVSADVALVRKQLAAPGWTRLITVDSKNDRELVEVYSWMDGGTSGGMAILVSEPSELTVVNIVGPLDPAKIGALQGQLGIPRLPAVGR